MIKINLHANNEKREKDIGGFTRKNTANKTPEIIIAKLFCTLCTDNKAYFSSTKGPTDRGHHKTYQNKFGKKKQQLIGILGKYFRVIF